MKNLVQAHTIAIAALQTTEDNGRQNGQYTESDEGLMDSVNHFGGIGMTTGKEEHRS